MDASYGPALKKSTILEVLHKLQKGAARVIIHANRRAHSRPIFYKLHILNMCDPCLTRILLFVYKSINLLLPTRYNNYFTPLEKKYLYYTRGSKQNLHVLKATKTCRYNSLWIRGPKYWNKVAYSLKIATSYPIFKCRLKEFLLNQNQ